MLENTSKGEPSSFPFFTRCFSLLQEITLLIPRRSERPPSKHSRELPLRERAFRVLCQVQAVDFPLFSPWFWTPLQSRSPSSSRKKPSFWVSFRSVPFWYVQRFPLSMLDLASPFCTFFFGMRPSFLSPTSQKIGWQVFFVRLQQSPKFFFFSAFFPVEGFQSEGRHLPNFLVSFHPVQRTPHP